MMSPPTYKPAIPFRQQKSDLRARIGAHAAKRLAKYPGVKRLARWAAEVFVMEDFLDADTCARLRPMILAGCQPSTVVGQTVEGFRTSRSCNLDADDPFVAHVDGMIAGLLDLPVANSETIQGQVYAVGQQFKPHPDFFHVDQDSWDIFRRTGGQRTWTAMVCLNEPEGGGETFFPHLDIRVKPKTGLLLVWNNMSRDGSPNAWTFHEGCPVLAGEKFIITKWFREEAWYLRPPEDGGVATSPGAS